MFAIAVEPFYWDWTFWSFVVAAIALLVSLAGPISRVVGPKKIAVELPGTVALDHYVGDPTLNLYMEIRNIGSVPVRIKSISADIKRDDGSGLAIQGWLYFEKSNLQQGLLLTPFSLKSKESWANHVRFYNIPSRQKDRRIRTAIGALKKEISRLQGELAPVARSSTVVSASEGFCEPLREMASANFFWLPGEYRLDIRVATEPVAASATKAFRFVLYEGDSSDLRSAVERYSTGNQVWYWSEDFSIHVRISDLNA